MDAENVNVQVQATDGPDLHGFALFRATFVPLMVNVLSGLSFGYNTAVTGPVLDKIDFEFDLTPWDDGEITAAVLLGAALGSSFAGVLTDKYGRVPSLVLASILSIIGSIVAGISSWWALILVARLLLGGGVGIMSFVAPVYSSETVATKIRGMVISAFQLFVCIGILLSYLLGMFFHEMDHGWRWMFGIGSIYSITVIAMIVFKAIPESPKWLESKADYQPFTGDTPEAINSEYKPYQGQRRDRTPNTTGISLNEEEYTPFEGEVKESGSDQLLDKPILWRDFLRNRRLRRALVLGFGLALGQQFCGVNAIFYYAPKIMKETGLPPSITSVAIAGFNVLVMFIAVFLVERLGRRKLVLGGYAGLTLSCALMAAFLMPSVTAHVGGAGTIAFIATLLYVLFFEMGPGPLFFVLIGEVFPLKARGRAAAICNGAAWASNLIVSFTFPALQEAIGVHNCFIIFGAICVVVTVFAFFRTPETKGIPLEDINV